MDCIFIHLTPQQEQSSRFDPVISLTLCSRRLGLVIFLYLDAKGELATGWNINLLQCCVSQISHQLWGTRGKWERNATDRSQIWTKERSQELCWGWKSVKMFRDVTGYLADTNSGLPPLVRRLDWNRRRGEGGAAVWGSLVLMLESSNVCLIVEKLLLETAE